ncbi:WW domain protein [Fusarium subglutinans]|uniref:WW domain protein n=1 Tax=Gibberella subglutinans TaxID=42677 RepID=A0A8H5V9A6_GIBSU|nr:WW domain protein [Fusarium subglutinans]KAF5613550.1 WW domain protein [Fusarium subglutinans]
MAASDKNDTVVESIEGDEASEVTHSGAEAESAVAQLSEGREASKKIEQATTEASNQVQPLQSSQTPRGSQPQVSQSPRTAGRPLAPAQVQHAQMVQHQSPRVAQPPYPQMPQSPYYQMPQSPHHRPPSPQMAQHPHMGYVHPYQAPHSPYMAQSPHQMPQSPYQIPQSPHPHMPQSPHPHMPQSPHPQIPPSPYMAHPHYAPQPGDAPPQSPLFTPQGTPIMTPQQSPLFTPLATPRFTPTPTPGPQSAAPTPAPSATPAPSSVASTPAPSSVASTPAPESSSGGQVTYDMGPPPKKKRGPKPKPLSERKMLRTTPIVRKEASYSKRKKEEVIMWMLHTRVDRRGEMVPPSTTDAENHFQIPRSTIAGWKKAMLGLGPIPKPLFAWNPVHCLVRLHNLPKVEAKSTMFTSPMSDNPAKTSLKNNPNRCVIRNRLRSNQTAPQPEPTIQSHPRRTQHQNAQKAYDELKFDRESHGVTVLPLELNDLKGVKSFAEQTLDKIGGDKIDYLLLNAGLGGVGAEGPGPHGSRWCEPYVVNHLSQHYLVHLLREKLVDSKSRIVFVSSGAIRRVSDPSLLDTELKAGSGASASTTYCNTKFTGLLGAQWWRRQLAGTNDVVAVSPGLIPGTGLANRMGIKADMADAKPIPEGAQSVLAAMTRSDFPEDRDRLFLTSWGEWWEKSVIEKSTDKELQGKWCPSKEEIEREAGISS